MNTPALVCNYALLRFRPYADGGEFVNVGLMLWCEQTGYFGYCSDTRCMGRVRGFFPHLDVTIYERAVRDMAIEMDRVGRMIAIKVVNHAGTAEHTSMTQQYLEALRAPQPKRAYQELIRKREGILTFGPDATAMTNDPQEFVEQLIARHLVPASESHRDGALVETAA